MACLTNNETNRGHQPLLRTLAINTTQLRFLILSGVGLFVLFFFLFDSTHENAEKPFTVDIISNEEFLRFEQSAPSSSSLQCAFDNESRLWLCVDQNKPHVLSEMHETNKLTLSAMTDFCGSLSYQSVYCTEERGELKCSCVYEPPTKKTPNDHICTRNARRNWVCLDSVQNLTFGNVTLLASILPKTLPSNHTMSCLPSPTTRQWQCDDILQCVRDNAGGLSCWGGGARAVDVSSLHLFSETLERILSVHNELSSAPGTSSNTTELMCQFNVQKDVCKCVTVDARPTTYQCAFKDEQWLCLHDHGFQSFDSLKHLTACVQNGPSPVPPTAPSHQEEPSPRRQLRTCDDTTPQASRTLQASPPPPNESQHSKFYKAHNKQRRGPRINLYDHHESLNLLNALISAPQLRQRQLRVPPKILKLVE